MKKRKILYISGTRADYGLMRPVLFEIKRSPKLDLAVAATGMHLMKEFGYTLNEIKKDGHKLVKINAVYEKDSKGAMAGFIGKFLWKLTEEIQKLKPDIILILGDRGEMLGAAIAGTYLSIPVIHLAGGDVTSTVDDAVRHAITKLSHVHLPATKKSGKRILNLGEDPWRVHVVGATSLDAIASGKFLSKKTLALRLDLDPEKPILIVLQHPVTEEIENARFHMETTLKAIADLKEQTVVIYPNADAGGREMIGAIEQFRGFPFIKILKSVEHDIFLSLMKYASLLIGNSSCGIVEAPSLHLPVINIGMRQSGREQGSNIINVNYNKKEIIRAAKLVLKSDAFKKKIEYSKNPYGDGKSSKRVIKILNDLKIDKKLLCKKITY